MKKRESSILEQASVWHGLVFAFAVTDGIAAVVGVVALKIFRKVKN